MDKDKNVRAANSGPEPKRGHGDTDPTYGELREQNRKLNTLARELAAELQEAHAAAQLQREQLGRLIQEAPYGISILEGSELTYWLVNPAYQRIFPGRELLGRPILKAVPEMAHTHIPPALERVYRTGETYVEQEQPLSVARHEGMPPEEAFFTVTYQARRNAEGEVDGVLVFAHEITGLVLARRALERGIEQAGSLTEELETTNRDLTRTNLDLDSFVYTASHDLKAPLLNLEGLLGTLVREVPAPDHTPKFDKVTGMINSSLHRFRQTLENLAAIARPQRGEEAQEEPPVILGDVIRDVRLDIAEEIERAKAVLEVDVDACPPVPFPAKDLRSVVYNLLSNALKYRSPERRPLVKVGCRREGDLMVLTVQDNGLGIDMDEAKGIFEKHRRLHDHVEGTGLGLYMVKRAVEKAGGRIAVESRVGEGTTFTVELRREGA